MRQAMTYERSYMTSGVVHNVDRHGIIQPTGHQEDCLDSRLEEAGCITFTAADGAMHGLFLYMYQREYLTVNQPGLTVTFDGRGMRYRHYLRVSDGSAEHPVYFPIDELSEDATIPEDVRFQLDLVATEQLDEYGLAHLKKFAA